MNASHMVNSASFLPAAMAPIRAAHPKMTRRQTTAAPVPRSIIKTGISTPRTIESIAYAGVDMPVHLVVTRQGSSGTSASHRVMILDYPAFSRLLREKAPRDAAIAILAALGAHPTEDKASGCRSWVQIQVQSIISTPLSLSTLPTAPTQQIRTIAA